MRIALMQTARNQSEQACKVAPADKFTPFDALALWFDNRAPAADVAKPLTAAQTAYASYCAYCNKADVKPYSYRYWVTEVYRGNETDPACNWN